MNPEDFEKFLKDFMAGKGGDAAELAAAAQCGVGEFAGVFPFARVGETVKVEMPNGLQALG